MYFSYRLDFSIHLYSQPNAHLCYCVINESNAYVFGCTS
jgi:hypothetical protein